MLELRKLCKKSKELYREHPFLKEVCRLLDGEPAPTSASDADDVRARYITEGVMV